MTINQSQKYKKFLVGAASAALVASAVAPVVSAADLKATKGKTHDKAIEALSNSGIISGYPDGSFKPNKTLTRSDVVKFMGKWLVSKGYKVPTDYKTNPRFSDLKSNSNDELLKYAAIVKDNGVFNGSDGRLLASDNITRENMAVVLVRAFDRVHDIELIKYVGAQDFKKDVTDLMEAKAEARSAIDVLDFFDITNPESPKFNPRNTTTRGQFATFLYKSINTDFSAAKKVEVNEDQVAVDAAADLVKAGTVEVSRGEQATAENKLVAVQAYVDGLIAGKGVVAKVVVGTTINDYKVTLTKGEAKAEKAITVTVVFAVDDRFVTKVKSINATQLEVSFSTAVAANSVLNADGSFIAGTVTLWTLDGVTAIPVSGKLSADGKVLTVTTTAPLSKRYDFKVENLKSKDGKTIDKYTEMITIAADKTAPTILNVERVSASQMKVKFSEPMKAFTATTFKYEDGSAVNGITGVITTGANEIIFTMDTNVSVTKRIVATFIGAQDQAGNLITPNPATVSFLKEGADGVAPVITSITQSGATTFAVKFSEQLIGNPIVTVGGIAVTTIVKDATDSTTYNVTVGSVLDGAKTVAVSSFSDLSGEAGVTTSKVVTFVKDSNAPRVVTSAVVQDATNGKEYLELTFDKNINLATAPAISNVSGVGTYVKDFVTSDSTNFATTQVSYKNASDKKVVRVELNAFLGTTGFKAATYTLDLTFTNLASDTATAVSTAHVTFTRGEDGSSVSNPVVAVTSIVQNAGNNNKVNVTFDKAVDGASAINPTNYKIDGAIVESVTLNPVVGGTQVAVLNLKADSNAFTGIRNINIENIKALGSSIVMEPYFTNTVLLTENVAPTVTFAKLTDVNKVTLIFSEAVNTTAVTTDFELLIGGGTTATNEKVSTPAGTGVNSINLILQDNITNENIASGFSLKGLPSLNIVDAAGNKLSLPVNISITQ
ncbi:S-layer homology domain-containing protein [Sporosarcina limicola]|uniref:SLH domain-containing protein n=1 Tax=Sporosarcina limicola TaxID=34101 RepID=A0A927MKY2_9BACL|nr:S-layer homology domain-containing protein [Sporosarcina limicola]MBE1556639.1 hypothetical protein [Sporosarcina limicola]